jgi:hypothetical protein
MSEYLIQDTTLTGIADAVREKKGSTDLIPVTSLAEEIKNLPSGGGGKFTSLVDRSITEVTAEDLNGVTSIGNHTFYYCVNLTSVEIPSSVTNIDTYAFYNCKSLTSIPISDTITSIGNYAFAYTKIEDIHIPINIKIIPNGMCNFCSKLTSVVIPSGVTEIKPNAFVDCSQLTTIVLNPTTPPIISIASYSKSFGSNITQFIVPKGYGDVYKSATNWSTLADKIVEAEE